MNFQLLVRMRNFLKLLSLTIIALRIKIGQLYYKFMLGLKFYMLGVQYGSFTTGGALMKLYISKRGKLIIGQNVDFANKWEVGYPNKIYIRIGKEGCVKIGDNVGINSSTIICDDRVEIGNNVHIGGNSKIYDTNFHNMNYLERRNPNLNGVAKTSPVIIEDDVFIGIGVLIGKGVRIGARSIIAAGSVVVKSVPSDELWGGNPAKFIKKINI